jgi:hypothetical protein
MMDDDAIESRQAKWHIAYNTKNNGESQLSPTREVSKLYAIEENQF